MKVNGVLVQETLCTSTKVAEINGSLTSTAPRPPKKYEKKKKN